MHKPLRIRLAFTSNNSKIHSTAIVHPGAQIAPDVEIGPFCVIESDVTIASGCKLESRVVIKSGTVMGQNNHLFEGVIVGGYPQHVHMPDHPGRVILGEGNTIRENSTIHRALEEDEATVMGDNNLLMVNAHVAHDCRVGSNAIFANNAMLAGHVTVGDRAYVSGGVGVHQFCRIGSMAIVGGLTKIVKDVPPFVTVDGSSAVGLNHIGLRRAGYADQIRQLKAAYRVIYRSNLTWNEILARLREEFTEGLAAQFYQFLSTTTRGIVCERRLPPGATLKLRPESATDAADAPLVPMRAAG